MKAGQRPHFVTIQRATVETDTYGGEVRTWHDHATGWARIRYGTGQERREAAQENASLAITAEFDWNPTMAGVLTTDRLYLFDTVWDITSRAVIGANREVHLTAIATLDVAIDS